MPSRLTPLPLDDAWPEIRRELERHRNLVLVAEPGAGKTTRFPPSLLQDPKLLPASQKALVLEPRRLAARAAAARIAEEQGWELGREVGYQVRFENKSSAGTRLLFLTEGLLSRKLISDPELKDVGAVCLDEFHERSQHTDLAIGLLYELQQLSRPDLRLIVMSATIDAERVAKFLGDCPIVKVPGRTYPVDIRNGKQPLQLNTGPGFLDAVAELVAETVAGTKPRQGDVLVFLPGTREIRGVRERVQTQAERAGFHCHELHGSLSLEDQDRAIRPSPGKPKIVLATNIAETSLTIDGVGTVIDTGLARVVRADSLGFPRLMLSRISLASATQRAGRAGRQGPGLAYRLWSKIDEASMPAFEQPELLRTELSEPLLALLAQGVTDPENFSWFERPPEPALASALATLTDLGLRDPATGALTAEGREALKLPTSPRLARLLLEAVKAGRPRLGAKLAALLSEKDIVARSADIRRLANVESDALLRLNLLEQSSGAIDRFAARNVERVADLLESAAGRVRRESLAAPHAQLKGLDDDQLALRLLLLAFPDRVARRRRAGEPAARMVGGKGVTLAPFTAVERAELFVAIDSMEPPPHLQASGAKSDAQISIASRIERQWLETFFPRAISRASEIELDSATKAVVKQTAQAFRDLPIEEPHASRPTADEAFAVLAAECARNWDAVFQSHEDLQGIFDRLEFLARNLPGDEAARPDLAAAKTAFLEEACFGETRLSDVLGKSLEEIFLRHLPSATAKLLQREAPAKWLAPTGNHVRLHYPADRAPYLEIRIQEVFGLKSSPRLAQGRIAVVMHLLGPNFRPVQVTSDLGSFWKSGYQEVRKELRARYPKHSWPEDPTTAPPTARGGRRH